MAVPYYNQTITGYSTTSVSSLTTSSVTTSGNFFVAIVSFRTSTGGSVSSFSDSKGNKWTALISSPASGGIDETSAAYYAQNATSGTLHTFTLTLTGASAPSITVIEFKDVASYASVDYQSYYVDAAGTTTHTLPTTPTLSPGFSVMVVADNGADAVGAATAYTADNTNGWILEGGIATGTNNTWCTKVFARMNPTSTTLTPSFTTAGSVICRVWLLNVRTKIPKTTNNKSFLFSNQANTRNFTDPRFLINPNGENIRIDSGIASCNNSVVGATYVIDLNSVYDTGTIGAKTTIRASKGGSISGDGTGLAIWVNSGANIWKGYQAYFGAGYARLARMDSGASNPTGSAPTLIQTFSPINQAENQVLELKYTPSTGALNFYVNDGLFLSATDTTYTSNLSPGFTLHWGNLGTCGISDYTPTGNVTTYCVGTTASNTSGTPFGEGTVAGAIAYDVNGYIATQTGKITHATIGINDWLGSTAAKIIPYDTNQNRIGTSVATLTSSQGTGIITAQFDIPFDVVKGQKYYIAISPNSYIQFLASAEATTSVWESSSTNVYNNIPNTIGGLSYTGPKPIPTVFLSGYPIPAAMSIQANAAVKVTNIVEYQPFSVSDNFNRADGAIGSNWTSVYTPTYGVPQISSNRLVSVGTGERATYTSSTFANNQYSECTVGGGLGTVSVGTTSASLIVRGSNTTSEWYSNVIYSDYIEIYKRVGGTSTLIAGGAYTVNTGAVVRLSVQGNCITTYVNGVAALSAVDSALNSGYPGIGNGTGGGTGVILDNWVGGDLPYTTYNFSETNATKLTTINPAFYGQYISSLQTLSANLVTTSFGGSIKAVYGKGFKVNQSSQVTKTNSINTSQWISIHSITDQTNDGYAIAVRTGTTGMELYRAGSVVAGPYTVTSAPASSTTTVKLESVAQANGSLLINTYYNGSLVGTYTDLYPLPVGKPAFWVNTTTAAADDPIGEFTAGGEAPKSQLYANGTFVTGEYIEN